MLTIVGNAIIARIIDAFSAFVPLDISTFSADRESDISDTIKIEWINISHILRVFFFLKIFAVIISPVEKEIIRATGSPHTSMAAEISAPPLFCKTGAKTTIAKNPYATEGMAARSSTTGLKILAVFDPTISFRHTAVKMPSGTAMAQEPTVTIIVP